MRTDCAAETLLAFLPVIPVAIMWGLIGPGGGGGFLLGMALGSVTYFASLVWLMRREGGAS